MPLVPFSAGQKLTATQLNAAFDIRRRKYQAADQTVNNTTTLVSSTDLTLSVAANSVYTLDAFVIYVSGTTPDIKFNYSYPSGASLRFSAYYIATTDTTGNAAMIRDVVDDFGAFGAGGIGTGMMSMIPQGRLTVGATAGNFVVQFAQFTANVSNTLLKAGSWIELVKVA